MIAKVEPLTPARALRGPFDYRLPLEMESIGVGSVLVVPFGRRRLLGVVVDVAEESDLPPGRLVEPLAALEGGVPADLVKLGLWVAEEYCSTPARGLSLVLPPGTGTGAARPVGARRQLQARITDHGRRALTDGERLGEKQRALLEALIEHDMSAAAAGREAGASHQALRRLEERGLVELEKVRVSRRPRIVGVGAATSGDTTLTSAQRSALTQILRRLESNDPGKLLLHGVTGSGKTEVYIRAVAATLERKRSAIVLVPEIALTPQTAARFQARFGAQVAIMHSRLSAGERYDEWTRLRSGEARVCVGPRSAVFAPLPDVGLIVIDEEHDSSYKQEGDPRYDARTVAERRAEHSGALILAGTATPRPESWHRLERLSLPERVDGCSLPPVELLGMAGRPGALHPRTREALERVRANGEKAIVLLNRRGWSNFLTCRVCGRAWECPECDVTLVLHRAAARVSCHHCGHSEPVPGNCPDCGSVSVARHGAGTERLESELESLLSPLPVFRLDSDSAAGAGGIAALLERFDRASAGVLLGTQMVAKGHDFPDVTLGVVLDADATLRFPDFRAEERTFALVAQLAGRSGRGPRGGSVIVQALDAEARALRHAAEHDAEGFLAGELDRRRLLRYPPFSHLIRVVCASPDAAAAHEAAAAIRARIPRGAHGELADGSVLGPAPLFKLKGRERAQLVVKAEQRAPAVRAVRRAVEAEVEARPRAGVSFAVDVDPQ